MRFLLLSALMMLGSCQKAQTNLPIPSTKDSVSTYHRFQFQGTKPDSIAFLQHSSIMDETVKLFLAFIEKSTEKPTIHVQTYSSFAQKAYAIKNQTCASVDEKEKISVVWSDDEAIFNCLDGSASVESLLPKMLGKPQILALERGFAMHFVKNWRFKGHQHWGAKIHQSGFSPTLQSLLTPAATERRSYQQSTLIQQALVANLVDFLIQKWGKETFIAKYPSLSMADILPLASDFDTYLSNLPTQSVSPIPAPHQIQKGFNFAHEGYNITDGYMGSSAVKSIAKMDSLGVNALAIVPYSFMRDPKTPNPFSIPQGAGGENDESVIFSAIKARQKGMNVLLKPQIWIHDSWPGAVEFDSEEKSKQFFKDYTQWIAHYALMAEMYDIEILCVATEFGKMTKNHEDKWIEMFQKIRKLYRGKLTVAAHWQGDFEHKPFWDELDFIGINLYKSLSEKADATDEELYQGALKLTELVKNQAKTFGKPVLLTETGFTATSVSWKNPFEYADGKDLNIGHQTRAYQAFLKAMIEEKAVAGIYFWKFPSYLSYGGLTDNDFTPNNKPAEKLVEEWYKKWN